MNHASTTERGAWRQVYMEVVVWILSCGLLGHLSHYVVGDQFRNSIRAAWWWCWPSGLLRRKLLTREKIIMPENRFVSLCAQQSIYPWTDRIRKTEAWPHPAHSHRCDFDGHHSQQLRPSSAERVSHAKVKVAGVMGKNGRHWRHMVMLWLQFHLTFQNCV